MADYSIVRRSVGRIRLLIDDLMDYVRYKRAYVYVDVDSPQAAELDREWHDYKLTVRDVGKEAV